MWYMKKIFGRGRELGVDGICGFMDGGFCGILGIIGFVWFIVK